MDKKQWHWRSKTLFWCILKIVLIFYYYNFFYKTFKSPFLKIKLWALLNFSTKITFYLYIGIAWNFEHEVFNIFRMYWIFNLCYKEPLGKEPLINLKCGRDLGKIPRFKFQIHEIDNFFLWYFYFSTLTSSICISCDNFSQFETYYLDIFLLESTNPFFH